MVATSRRAEEVDEVLPGRGGHPPTRRGGRRGAACLRWPPRHRAEEVGKALPACGGHPAVAPRRWAR
jgi:hypothetical protein